jgi:hypothetical protein
MLGAIHELGRAKRCPVEKSPLALKDSGGFHLSNSQESLFINPVSSQEASASVMLKDLSINMVAGGQNG